MVTGNAHEAESDVVLGVGAPTELPESLVARLRDRRRRGGYRLVLAQDLLGGDYSS
jgi:hypothetical protein